MVKPLSTDLRQRIIDVYADEELSQQAVADRFCVSLSSVRRLVKSWQNGESLEPKPHGGGQSPALDAEQLERVKRLIEAHHDATLAELQVLVEAQESVWVSQSTMGRVTQKLRMTRKKNAAC
ncbi:MAG: transposase [Cyanobacteria bacterium J06598_3]